MVFLLLPLFLILIAKQFEIFIGTEWFLTTIHNSSLNNFMIVSAEVPML
jgi:hypothetical protein